MGRKYEEKLLEDLIRDHPHEFLGEDLSLYQQQPSFGGFRPDLVFRDEHDGFVILEVQLNALDRGHLYRTLEYRDLLAEQEGCNEPRVILFCNAISKRYAKLLKTHRVACISITKEEFLQKAFRLRPDLKIIDKPKTGQATVWKVLRKLRGKVTDGRDDPDALVFWFPDSFPGSWWPTKQYGWEHLTLPELPDSVELYFRNDYRDLEDDLKEQVDQLKISQLPRELIVGRTALEALTLDHLNMIVNWTDLVADYLARQWPDTAEIVLGHRLNYEFHLYEDHIRTHIRHFEPIWRRYGFEKGCDVVRLRSDLDLLGSLTFYAGKCPALVPIRICERIVVEEGLGPLRPELEEYRRMMRDVYKRDVDVYVAEESRQWLTIRFCKVMREALESLRALSRMLLYKADWKKRKGETVRNVIEQIGLMPARRLSDLTTEGLALSAKYFFHLKAPTERSDTAAPKGLHSQIGDAAKQAEPGFES